MPAAAYGLTQVHDRGGIHALFYAQQNNQLDAHTQTGADSSQWNKSNINPISIPTSPTSIVIPSMTSASPNQAANSEVIETDLYGILGIVGAVVGSIATYELITQASTGIRRHHHTDIAALERQFALPDFDGPRY